jgi:hypothetical protein
MKLTNIKMEWTDTGARVFWQASGSSLIAALNCPLCGTEVASGIEHLCGDRVSGYVAPKKKRARTVSPRSAPR